MLSIDEMIELHKMKARASKNFNARTTVSYATEEHEQLAELLQELKAYRDIGTVEECKNSVLDILKAYNKAIDDFKKILSIEKIKEYAESDGFININNCSLMIFDIAEQLKVGGKNERM